MKDILLNDIIGRSYPQCSGVYRIQVFWKNFYLIRSESQRKEKDREDIASQLGRQKYVLILRQLNQSQCPHFTAQPLLRTLKYTLADEEGTLHSWRKAFIEMNLHFGRNSLIIAMLIGLISTWYGHNVALRVRSISSFSMTSPNQFLAGRTLSTCF